MYKCELTQKFELIFVWWFHLVCFWNNALLYFRRVVTCRNKHGFPLSFMHLYRDCVRSLISKRWVCPWGHARNCRDFSRNAKRSRLVAMETEDLYHCCYYQESTRKLCHCYRHMYSGISPKDHLSIKTILKVRQPASVQMMLLHINEPKKYKTISEIASPMGGLHCEIPLYLLMIAVPIC